MHTNLAAGFFIIALVGGSCHAIEYSNAITYRPNKGGRFGDHILTYCKAYWVAYTQGLRLLYVPFTHSESLVLSCCTTPMTVSPAEQMPADQHTISSLFNQTRGRTLYHIDLKCSVGPLADFGSFYRYCVSNPDFTCSLNKLIQPIEPLNDIPVPPSGCISVAIHVRKGGGFDMPLLADTALYERRQARGKYADCQYPRRFPPEQFYTDQLVRLSKLLNHAPLYVRIFTDDPKPAAVAKRFKHAVPLPNVTFDYRRHNNHHTKNVLEDFFAMMQYDCLIRPASSYSKVAQLLGNHYVIMYPQGVKWINNKLTVTSVGTLVREYNWVTTLNSDDQALLIPPRLR